MYEGNERSMVAGNRLAENTLGYADETTETEWVAGVQENVNTEKWQQPKPIEFYCV